MRLEDICKMTNGTLSDEKAAQKQEMDQYRDARKRVIEAKSACEEAEKEYLQDKAKATVPSWTDTAMTLVGAAFSYGLPWYEANPNTSTLWKLGKGFLSNTSGKPTENGLTGSIWNWYHHEDHVRTEESSRNDWQLMKIQTMLRRHWKTWLGIASLQAWGGLLAVCRAAA